MIFRIQQYQHPLFFFILALLFCFVWVIPAAAFTMPAITVDPPKPLVSGTPENVTFTVDFQSSGGETFPSIHELQFSTDLENARWNYSLILDGVENPQPPQSCQMMSISGWLLSYPPTVRESLNVTLEGTVPSVSSPSDKTILDITEIDSGGIPVTGTQVTETTLVNPSDAYYTVAPEIARGATLYIGEQGLNLTRSLNRAGGLDGPALDTVVPTNWTIGWFIAYPVSQSSPFKTLNISTQYQKFTVAQTDFVGYAGYWYLVNPATGKAIIGADGLPRVVFMVSDPHLDLRIWDFDNDMDVTGKSIPRGDSLGFRIDTNMYSAINSLYRSPVDHDAGDGYIDIRVRNESGFTFTQLYDTLNNPHDLLRQNVSSSPWTWGDPENPASPDAWATGAMDSGGRPLYPSGTYTVWAESLLNNMKANYRQGGADYTRKTVSDIYTITLVADSLFLESNTDSLMRGDHFSVIISGKPKTAYYLWVKNTGSMTGAPADQPPTILVSAPVYQDPAEGPYAIGAHPVLGAGGKTVLDDVPPSTVNVTRNEYYAKVVTSSSSLAVVEFRTSPDTKPGTYTIRAENDAHSDEVLVNVVPEILPVPAATDEADQVIYHPRINPDVPAPVNNDLKRISRGGTVFFGEQGLDVSDAVASADALAVPPPSPEGTVVGWWAYGIPQSPPVKTINLAGRETSLLVSPEDFIGYTGSWYLVDPSTGMAAVDSGGSPILVFDVEDPALGIKIWDFDRGFLGGNTGDVTGKSVPQGARLTFRIDTNMYPAFDTQYRQDITDSTPGTITIIVKNEKAARYNYLYQNNTTAISLLNQRVGMQPYFWGRDIHDSSIIAYWGTGLLDRDHYYFYPAGTYVVGVESTLNTMKANYRSGGADYTGKTVSQFYTITLVTVPGPVVTGIRPAAGFNTTSVSITNLAGLHFNTTVAPAVKLNHTGYADIVATGVTVIDSTNITCTFDLTGRPAGTWDVVVTNPDGRAGKLADGFTITAPGTTVVPPTEPSFFYDSGSSDDPEPAALPSVTNTVNVGGSSAVSQVIITGTGIAGLIVTGTVKPRPDEGPYPPGTVYQYFNLVPARFSTITGSGIFFSVPQSWLDQHQIVPENIILFHQTANGWIPLPTTVLSAKDGTVYFSAQNSGFSLFAIAGSPVATTPVNPGTIQVTPVSSPMQAGIAQTPVTVQTTVPPVTPATPPAPSSPVTVVPVIAAIGVLAGGVFLARHWWMRRQNPALFREYD